MDLCSRKTFARDEAPFNVLLVHFCLGAAVEEAEVLTEDGAERASSIWRLPRSGCLRPTG